MRSVAPLILLAVASANCADVKIFWHHEKSSAQISLSVFDGAGLVAQSCSSVLVGSPHNIDFSGVDENGFGNFSVGDDTYLSHSKPEYSGGPVCTKKYNADVAVVECSGVSWMPSPDVEIEEGCHSEYAGPIINFFTNSKREVAEEPRVTRRRRDLSPLSPRQDCQFVTVTKLVGDGNPHQNFYDKQLSENIHCNASPSCSAGHEVEKSFTIGWSAEGSAAGWISGGFAVQETWTTGDAYTCYGGQGDEVCVWYNTAHTAYTVQNFERNTCEREWYPTGNPFVMYSPNQQNRNGGYYCVIGTCRAQGDAYWDKSGRPGGP